ncbi:Protein bric-a-brac 2 [Araneus ventricosus]|uniref:Protein bric-a-brac 2 n=1 Tax=Araneus ventricosus TaxID=182803 RepID=A0A4Y2IP45_ARAVE|nr:Protein bric-a-brac 2 [Araneus ventricosus]
MAQQFRLKWSNHMNNVLDVVKNLFLTESLVDVTLACDGMSIKAHKVILSACSPFFQSLLLENPCQHPIIIIPHMKYSDLKPLIDFMYEGEISVTRDQLATLTKNARDLKIKGLAEISFEKTFSNESPMVADHGFTPTESSSPIKQAGDHVQEQSLNGLKCDDNSKDEKAKSQPSNIEELSSNILVNTNYHYETPQGNDSSQNFELPESADTDNIRMDHSKSAEEIITPDNFSNPRNDVTTSLQSKKKTPESNTDSFSDASQMSMPFEAVGSNDQPESSPDIKPELIESDPSMSPVPGPSHDTEDSMMMDQSSTSSHPEVYEEDDTNLGRVDSQPEGNSSIIRTIYFSKNVPDNEEDKSGEEVSTSRKKWKYKCYKCNLLVASKGHLAIHMRTHTGERPFSCYVCGKTAIRQHDLQLHMRTHTGIKPYACPICGMKFNNSSNYRRHYKRRHPTAERVVQVCKLCDEQFDCKELLNGHLINQHAIQNSHVCVICQKSYKREYDLKTHLRVHSKEKPYSCKVCFKLFSYKSNQIRHIRQHFKKSKTSPAAERTEK